MCVSFSVHLKYSCSTDEYVRVSDEARVTRGWDHMTSEVSAVMRKEEHDWRMTYLAREEGAAEAHVSWKFDFTGEYCLQEQLCGIGRFVRTNTSGL